MPGTRSGARPWHGRLYGARAGARLPADHRADIFALGAILYEMLAGHRAFTGGTGADTMTAILTTVATRVPRPCERWQVSTSGGVQPEWRADGRELFLIDPWRTLIAVDIRTTPSFDAGPVRPLFQTRLIGDWGMEEYRVTGDGQRFLLRVPVGGATQTTLVLNWPALLKQ